MPKRYRSASQDALLREASRSNRISPPGFLSAPFESKLAWENLKEQWKNTEWNMCLIQIFIQEALRIYGVNSLSSDQRESVVKSLLLIGSSLRNTYWLQIQETINEIVKIKRS